MMRKRYVAKVSSNLGKFHESELSPRFESVHECLEFIKTNREILITEYLLSEAFYSINSIYYDENDNKKIRFIIRRGSMIRVFDLEQNRFCDSFDF